MARQVFTDHRADFRGGRLSTLSRDMIAPNELLDATNARVLTFGAISKRTGSRRIHATAIGAGAAVRGLVQWNAPSIGQQVVAIANGNLYHKTSAFGEFTEVVPASAFSTTQPTFFSTFRANSSGAPLVLYAASGGKVYSWTGSVLTRIDGVSAIPTAEWLAAYHTRMFYNDTTKPEFVVWSKVGDATVATVGLASDGGTAMVDVIEGDAITRGETVGNSLLLFTEDSIARFSGYSSDDIQIAQDTSGVASDVGLASPAAVRRVEQVAFFLSDRGPYMAMEAGISPIGAYVEKDFDDLDRTAINKSVVGYHGGRQEVWYAVPGASDGGLNKTVFVYNIRLQRWYGPFTYPFGITSLSAYEDSIQDNYLIAGCADGRVRHLDIGAKDDVLADASGGSTYTMQIELSPMFFQTGPQYVKAFRSANVQADLEAGHALTFDTAFDAAGFSSKLITGSGAGFVKNYFVPHTGVNPGSRLRCRLRDASATIPIVNGISVEVFDMFGRT